MPDSDRQDIRGDSVQGRSTVPASSPSAPTPPRPTTEVWFDPSSQPDPGSGLRGRWSLVPLPGGRPGTTGPVDGVGSVAGPSAASTGLTETAQSAASVCLLLVPDRDGHPLRANVEQALLSGAVLFRMHHVGRALVEQEVATLLEQPPAGLRAECGSSVLDAEDPLDRQIMRVLVGLARRRARPVGRV